MELIYLWIKGYKNIEDLGIPLSIDFQEKEKTVFDLKKDTLAINLLKVNNYNVFGNYLNVKTFVGANGSGKSNITTALCSMLRYDEQYDFEDYFDNSKPKEYCLIYIADGSYKCISTCENVDLYIDNKLQQLEKGESIKCSLFKPFLNIEDDTNLSFPKDVHINKIIERKLKNYFYYDRFRMYDTSQTLKILFKENKTKNFEILNGDNQYLIFDNYGYEIDIVQEFEWINRQLHNKIPLYFKKENIQFDRKGDFVEMLTDSNNFIIDKAKTDGYYDIKDFVNNVISNGCFMFLLIKIAELFSMLEGYENIITLIDLKNVLEDMVDFVHNEKAINKILSLNEIDIERKHRDLRDFYKGIQDEFERKIQEKSIREQFKDTDFLDYFSEFIDSLVKLEENLYSGTSNLYNILETKDGNLFRLGKHDYLNSVNDENDTEENKLLNSIGIFRRSYYKNKTTNETYSFYDLSTGEQRLLRFFADILSLEDKNVNVYVFDEMDLSWHPEWQRKMVYFIKDFFDKCKIKVRNVIFTTHSPFILSDMPASNVTMLCKNQDGMAEVYQNTPNSFCANIHDLFNDNFFFNNCRGICTIGEFAKKYIDEIKNDIIKYKKFFYDAILVSPILNKDSHFIKKTNELYKKIMLIEEPVIRKSFLKELTENVGLSILFKTPTELLSDYIELQKKYDELKGKLNEKD